MVYTPRYTLAPVATRQLLDRAQRRETILHGAASAFAEQGYAATSMEDVAKAAGITKLIVYRHFDSKQALYEAVLEQVAERLREEFMAARGDRRLGSVSVHALLVVAREDPAAFTLLWRHAAREPQFADHAEGIRERAVRATEAFLNSVGAQADQRWAAATLVSYVVAAVLHWLEYGDAARDADFERMMADSLPAIVGAWTH